MIDFSIEDRTLGRLLGKAAEQQPEWPFILHRNETVSYAEMERLTNQLCEGLRQWGVTRGSRVALMLHNSPQYLISLFAISKLGALNVPINTAARGDLLRYYLKDASCSHAIVQDSCREVLAKAWPEMEIPVATLCSDDLQVKYQGASWSDLLADGQAMRNNPPDVVLHGWDPWLILYTSGTTGPSKGSICPQAQSLTIGRTQSTRMELTPNDRLYTCLPLFHGNALNYSSMTALWGRSTIALETRFSASRFWPDVHKYGATQFNAMMIVTSILEKLPVTPQEANNPIRQAVLVPPPLNRRQLEERWNLKILSQYALSEACPVVVLAAGEAYDKPRTSGRAADNIELRIVDEHDRPLPTGSAGEIIIRPREPWTMLTAYNGKPEATANAFKNLWFHTGDRAYLDNEGYLFFVDRVKDAIRRRGENISAFEIEMVLKGHAGVMEVAAVPAPSDMGEDEVVVFVVKAQSNLTERDVIEYAIMHMAYYMVPRYVHFMDDLPKTPSEKVSKVDLREIAKTSYNQMWDREAHGISVTRFTAQERSLKYTD
jgi:crotonobetaine/carnitine-CoA ligase